MKVEERKPYLLHIRSFNINFASLSYFSYCKMFDLGIRPLRQTPLRSTDGPLSQQSVQHFWSSLSSQEPWRASMISPGHCSCEAGLKVQGVAPLHRVNTQASSHFFQAHTYNLPLASDNPPPAALCFLHYHIQAADLTRSSLENPAQQSKPSTSATHLKSNQLIAQGEPHSIMCKPLSSTRNGCQALISGGFQREVNSGVIFWFRNRK